MEYFSYEFPLKVNPQSRTNIAVFEHDGLQHLQIFSKVYFVNYGMLESGQ